MKLWDLAAVGGSRELASGPIARIPPQISRDRVEVEREYLDLLKMTTPMVKALAASASWGLDRDDVEQECWIALWRVVLMADPERGSTKALARCVLRNTVNSLVRRVLAPARMPRAIGGSSGAYLTDPLDTMNPGVADVDSPCPEAEAVRSEETATVRSLCLALKATLGPRDRVCLEFLLAGGTGWPGSGLSRGQWDRSLRRIRDQFGRIGR